MQVHVNPFFALRTGANLTLGSLSEYTGIDVRALRRCEKGLYTNPLPRLIDYWVNLGKATEGQLLSDYEDFQFNTRRSNLLLFGPELHFSLSSNIHPLRQLRAGAGLGLTECCESLCVPLDTVQWWEKKWRHQKSVPKGLMLAINQAGYTQNQVREFSNGYHAWRDKHGTVTFH